MISAFGVDHGVVSKKLYDKKYARATSKEKRAQRAHRAVIGGATGAGVMAARMPAGARVAVAPVGIIGGAAIGASRKPDRYRETYVPEKR